MVGVFKHEREVNGMGYVICIIIWDSFRQNCASCIYIQVNKHILYEKVGGI